MRKASFAPCASAVVACALLVGGALAEESHTLTGQFVWYHQDGPEDLEAVFTPTGAGSWEVSFHFTFRGQDHVYSGTATGSLSTAHTKCRSALPGHQLEAVLAPCLPAVAATNA